MQIESPDQVMPQVSNRNYRLYKKCTQSHYHTSIHTYLGPSDNSWLEVMSTARYYMIDPEQYYRFGSNIQEY